MRKYLIFNLIEFFLWGYTSYWDMTFNYKTNLSIQDSIFHSCTFIPLLWFIEVKKNIKMHLLRILKNLRHHFSTF